MPVVVPERVETGIDVVTFDRPDALNTLSQALIDDLEAALKVCGQDDSLNSRHAKKGGAYA